MLSRVWLRPLAVIPRKRCGMTVELSRHGMPNPRFSRRDHLHFGQHWQVPVWRLLLLWPVGSDPVRHRRLVFARWHPPATSRSLCFPLATRRVSVSCLRVFGFSTAFGHIARASELGGMAISLFTTCRLQVGRPSQTPPGAAPKG